MRYIRKVKHSTWLTSGLSIENIHRIFLQIFATVMPHFVIENIQDETGEVVIFFENHEPTLRALNINIFKKNHKARKM